MRTPGSKLLPLVADKEAYGPEHWGSHSVTIRATLGTKLGLWAVEQRKGKNLRMASFNYWVTRRQIYPASGLVDQANSFPSHTTFSWASY